MVDYFIDNQVFYHHGKFSHIVKVVLSETFLIGIAILKRLTIFVLVQTMLFYEKIITWFNSFIFYAEILDFLLRIIWRVIINQDNFIIR